ncbi:hypothetical protein R6Q59_000207 [Mikania micrantha]
MPTTISHRPPPLQVAAFHCRRPPPSQPPPPLPTIDCLPSPLRVVTSTADDRLPKNSRRLPPLAGSTLAGFLISQGSIASHLPLVCFLIYIFSDLQAVPTVADYHHFYRLKILCFVD